MTSLPRDPKPGAPPAPPPPPDVQMALVGHTGFRPHQGRALFGAGVVVGALAILTVGSVVFAGQLSAWLLPLVPMSVDVQLGSMAHKQMALGQEECGPRAQEYVETVAAPLLASLKQRPFELKFRVVNDPAVNAYALPGGYVTVNRGLLEAADSGEEVAGVLGHEIQHALLRHGTSRMLRQMGGSLVLSLVLGGTDFHGVGQLASQLTSLSYDRDQESEADAQGLDLLVRAGVDPRGLSTFFLKLKSEQSVEVPAILSTHPDSAERAERARALATAGDFKTLPSPKGIICQPASASD